MSLADTIMPVSRSPGFASKCSDLIGPKSNSTLFECQIAAIFGSDDWTVSFPTKATDATPDVVAQKGGQELAIECKRLEEEHWAKWARQLGLDVLHSATRQHDRPDRALEIEFDQRLSEILTADENVSRCLLEEIISRVSTKAEEVLRAESLPAMVRITEVASVTANPRTDSHHGAAGGIAISVHSRTRRIVQNGVLDALPQLASHDNGMAAVFCESVPSLDLLDLVMSGHVRADPDRFARLSAVLVGTYSTMSSLTPPVLWVHPAKRSSQLVMQLVDTLQRALPTLRCTAWPR